MSDSYDECIILYVHNRAPVHACVMCHNVQLYTQSACIKWHVPFNNIGLVYTHCYDHLITHMYIPPYHVLCQLNTVY